MRGIDLPGYQTDFGSDLRGQFNGELNRLKEAGLIELDDTSLKLTTRGALLSNEVFAALG
jgi:oxygen-independent coproporphyrinogen III oxidase